MAEVDVSDDGISRFVVYHYRYDAVRHERRHVLVAAFDNPREMDACLRATQAGIERRRAAGERVDRQEHASGATYEPGYLARAATGHVVRRMMARGIDPRPWLQGRDLPHNMALFGPEEQGAGTGRGWWGTWVGRLFGPRLRR